MRTRKNKKYLKKRRNKTKKYGGVATLSGRVSKKPAIFAQEQAKQREIETEQRQTKAKSKTTGKAKTTAKSKTKARTTKLDRTIVKPSININKIKLIKFLKARTEIKKDIQNAYNIKSSNPGKYGDFPRNDFKTYFQHITDTNKLNELIKNSDKIAKTHINKESYGIDAQLRNWFKNFKKDVIPKYTAIENIDRLLIYLFYLNKSDINEETKKKLEKEIKKIIHDLDIPNNKDNLRLLLESKAVKNNPKIVQELQTILM